MAEGLNWWKFLSDTVERVGRGRQRGECLIFHCQSNLILSPVEIQWIRVDKSSPLRVQRVRKWNQTTHWPIRMSTHSAKNRGGSRQSVPFLSFSVTTILASINALIHSGQIEPIKGYIGFAKEIKQLIYPFARQHKWGWEPKKTVAWEKAGK